MPRSLQAAVGFMAIALAVITVGGCAASREPVVVIEPTYSIVRQGGGVVAAAEASNAPVPLPFLIADAEPGF